jgi:hypothetical protein
VSFPQQRRSDLAAAEAESRRKRLAEDFGSSGDRPDPEPVSMDDLSTDACVLISASCTTSWFDWVHGELWLCPNGLLRRSLGVNKTIEHGNRGNFVTVEKDRRPTRTFTSTEIDAIVHAGRRNRWITWSQVSHATLKRGVIDHSLHLDLGGRREKFLWLKLDGGYDILEEALTKALPGRFEARNKAFG